MLDDITGRLLLVVLLLAAATVFIAVRRRRDGSFRPTQGGRQPRRDALTMSPAEVGEELGSRATLVQFSARGCATCPQVRRALADVAERADGVRHVEIAADERLDVAARMGVVRTPTVLLLDAAGTVRARASGPMTPEQAFTALAAMGIPAGDRHGRG